MSEKQTVYVVVEYPQYGTYLTDEETVIGVYRSLLKAKAVVGTSGEDWSIVEREVK